MEFLIRLWPLIKLLLAFAVMLIGIRFKFGLWRSILAGSLALALLFGMGFTGWARFGLPGAVQEKSLLLSAVVGVIMVLSDLMAISGQAERMMNALRGYLNRPTLRLVFFPALIGLLPMPGGAVFSAPMVRSASQGLAVREEDRAVINYWFRHIWEMCWPLYPGILMASVLAQVSIAELLSWIWPGTVASLTLGWFFLLRPLKLENARTEAETKNARRAGPAFRESLPILTAIIGSLVLEWISGLLFPDWPMEFGVLAGLVAAVLVCAVQNRVTPRRILALLGKKHLLSMLCIILAIFVFQETLLASGVIKQLAQLAGGEAALLTSAILLPFLTALVSGITLAYVGASFPLLIGMLHQLGMSDQMMPYVTLGMFSGFAGVLLSPLHVCFLLTCQYFKVGLGPCWRMVLRPASGVILFGAVYVLALMNF